MERTPQIINSIFSRFTGGEPVEKVILTEDNIKVLQENKVVSLALSLVDKELQSNMKVTEGMANLFENALAGDLDGMNIHWD